MPARQTLFASPLAPLPIHPRPGLAALAVFGGRPVWPILGGSEAATETGGTAAGTDQAAGTSSDAATAGTQQQAADPTIADDDDVARLAGRYSQQQLAALALRLRTEAGDRRAELRGAQQTAEQKAAEAANAERAKVLDQLKPALIAAGLLADDATPDPTQLAADLQAQTTAAQEQAAQARTLTIENSVLRSATALGINGDRLLDSRRFAADVASLDPAAPDFGSKIEAAMKAAAAKDASLKLRPGAGRGGVPLAGGSGEGAKFEAAPLYDAVAAAMNPTV